MQTSKETTKPPTSNRKAADRKIEKKRSQQNVLLFMMACFGYSFELKNSKKLTKENSPLPCLRILKVKYGNVENDVVKDLEEKIKQYPEKNQTIATTMRVIVETLCEEHGFFYEEKGQKNCNKETKHPILNFINYKIHGSEKTLGIEKIRLIGEDLNMLFKINSPAQGLHLNEEVLNKFIIGVNSGLIQLRDETKEFIKDIQKKSIGEEDCLGNYYVERSDETNKNGCVVETSMVFDDNVFVSQNVLDFSYNPYNIVGPETRMVEEQQTEINQNETLENYFVDTTEN